MKKKGVIYVRESTTKQDWETQLMECRTYCKKNDIEIGNEFVELISGARNDRKHFLHILDMIEKKEFDVLVVWELSRSTRDFITYKELIRTMIEMEIELHSLQEGILTEDDIDKMFSTDILALMNERERKIVGRRIKTRINFLKENGKWAGGRTPLGYDFVDKELVPNEDAPKVKEIFNLYLEGKKINEIAKIFSISDDKKISRILSNSVYIGKIRLVSETVNGKRKNFNEEKIFQGTHEPLIDVDTFELVQTIKLKLRKTSYKNLYLFTNLKCYCGAKMYPNLKNGQVTYACRHSHIQISSKHLEEQTFQQLEAKVDDFDILNNVESNPDNPKTRLKVFKNEIEKLEKQEKMLLNKYLEEKIPEKLYNETLSALKEKENNFKQEVLRLEKIQSLEISTIDNKQLLKDYLHQIKKSTNVSSIKKILNLIIYEVQMINNFRCVVLTNLE